MSISWQTGEPPRGVELLIEFEYEGNGRRMVSILDDEVLTRICILRWSTLDDDRSAMAMGALEQNRWTLFPSSAGNWRISTPRPPYHFISEGDTPLDAIEAAMADQQTKAE